MEGWGIYGDKTFILFVGVLIGMFICFSTIFLTWTATEAQNELEAERMYKLSLPVQRPPPAPTCNSQLECLKLIAES